MILNDFFILNKSKIICFILLVVIFSSLLHFQYYNYEFLINYPEFFINYSSGFIRRGFDGELIYLLSEIFSINPLSIRLFYWLVNLVVFIILIFRHFSKRFPIYFLFASTILLSEISGAYIFKKDLILINLFILLVYITKEKCFIQILLFNIILIVGTLMHEVFFIFSIVPAILILKTDKGKLYSFLYLYPRFRYLL